MAWPLLNDWYCGMCKYFKKWNTCDCKYCFKMAKLCLRFNMCSKENGVPNSCTCECEICCSSSKCNVHLQTFEGVRLLWYSILCPKGPLEEWFRFDCIFGKCKDYGVKSLKLCPHKIYVNGQLMQWKCFQKVSAGLTRAREGKKGHKTRKFWNLAIKLGYKSRERWLLEEGNKKCCVKKDKLLCVNHMSALIQFL